MLPISDILIRSISGYVFIIPVLIFYFLYMKKTGRKKNLFQITIVCLFAYYVFGVLTVTGIGYTGSLSFRPRISLIPFVGMISGPLDTILNLILFVPLGVFLPFLYKKYRHISMVAFTGLLFSLSVEIVQVFDWGLSDINDLIINTAGACLGYWIYCLLSKILPDKFLNKVQADNINGNVEVPLLVFGAFVIMITAQPWVVHTLLNVE